MNAADRSQARPATYRDLLDVPPHMVAEIVGGTLYAHPRPATGHLYAASSLTAAIFGAYGRGRGGPGGWWIVAEPELHLGPDIVVPDIAGWRRERLPDYPDAPWMEIAPDWVCEILSPATRRIDLGPKRDIYAREDVGHLWLIDPDARTLECLALKSDGWRLVATRTGADEVALPPFEAVAFPLSDLWPEGGAAA
jgi:Uma2 family endonuclease